MAHPHAGSDGGLRPAANLNPRSAADQLQRSQCRAGHPHADYRCVSRRKCACCGLLRPCNGIQPQLDSPETRRCIRPRYALTTNPVVPVLGDCCDTRHCLNVHAATHEYCRRSATAPNSLQTVDAVFCRESEEPGSWVESGYQRASRCVALGRIFKSRGSIGCQRGAAHHAMQQTRDNVWRRGSLTVANSLIASVLATRLIQKPARPERAQAGTLRHSQSPSAPMRRAASMGGKARRNTDKSKRRARDSNPQPIAGHLISSQTASRSLTLRRPV